MAVRRHDERRDGSVVAGHGRSAIVGFAAEVLEADVLRPEVGRYLSHALSSVFGIVLFVVVHLEPQATFFHYPGHVLLSSCTSERNWPVQHEAGMFAGFLAAVLAYLVVLW